ncbi:MAG: helix-turn-helix domain-containing protein [Candidatus Velthaea sp.]
MRDAPDDASARAPAVVRAARMLGELAQCGDAMSASDLARAVDMPKSSVSDLCLTLIEEGLLARTSDGRYLLGRHLVELARTLVGGTRVLEVFADACDAVSDADGESVTMSIADGSDVVIVAVRHGSIALPMTPKVGLHLPIWTTAAGRALLSAVSIDSLRDILGIESATAAGVSGALPSAEPLFAELRRESRLGVHIDEEQTALGMTSFSAPLLDGAESPAAAAIAISTRSSLASPKRRRTLSSATLRIADECVRRSRASD